MKKQLKLMSLLLSLTLLLISAAPLTANAFDSIDADATVSLITPSENAIYSVYGSAAPAGLCQELAALDVTVTSNTLIEVLPLSCNQNYSVLEVTNIDDLNMTKDLLISVTDTGTIADIIPTDSFSVNSYGNPSFDFNISSGITLHIAADFIYYSSYHFQPQAVSMIYYNTTSVAITNLTVSYICEGYEYSYPGYRPCYNGNLDTYRHEISIYESIPEAGSVYGVSNPYRSDRVIQVQGIVDTQHLVEFTLYVNGYYLEGSQDILIGHF